MLRAQGTSLVADFVRDVQAEPAAVFDLRQVVERGLASDPRTLVGLFERCGEKDLKFVIKSGLWLGGALGASCCFSSRSRTSEVMPDLVSIQAVGLLPARFGWGGW